MNTCPVDRLKFNQIEVYTSLDRSPVRTVSRKTSVGLLPTQHFSILLILQVEVPDVCLSPVEADDTTYCEVSCQTLSIVESNDSSLDLQ